MEMAGECVPGVQTEHTGHAAKTENCYINSRPLRTSPTAAPLLHQQMIDRKVSWGARIGLLDLVNQESANRLPQHGHAPSYTVHANVDRRPPCCDADRQG